MSFRKEEASRFHTVQAERDPEANWEVDLSSRLEQYLLKICSGEITSSNYDNNTAEVNFAEAALLLQGSIQVYSRKVEYLYNLVLHALEFLCQRRHEGQEESTSPNCERRGPLAVHDDESDDFWCSTDVPVEARNCLDASTSKEASFYNFVKPPANLVVLEGDCLDTIGDGGELESYLLATADIYRDFILLDPSDAAAVNENLKNNETSKWKKSSLRSDSTNKQFKSPMRLSVSAGSSLRKKQFLQSDPPPPPPPPPPFPPAIDYDCIDDMQKPCSDLPASDDFEDNDGGNIGNSADLSSDDESDPWKPLNPHESGKLKVMPFQKVKAFRKIVQKSPKKIALADVLPIAKLRGPISPELTKIWESQQKKLEKQGKLKSPTMYEKLRKSLVDGCFKARHPFYNAETHNQDIGIDDGGDDDGGDDDVDDHHANDSLNLSQFCDEIPKDVYVEDFENKAHNSPKNLEDLCRIHLDSLLASLAENEKQSELAARVSSWKQNIECSLEEQDSRPPFDIHAYGMQILHKFSLRSDSDRAAMSFADVAGGLEKHEVARTFSALLQLVNNGDVALDKRGLGGESVCFTAQNPFYVRLLRPHKKPETSQFSLSRKRSSPLQSPLYPPAKEDCFGAAPLPRKLSKVGGLKRCTSNGKRRRRSCFVDPIDSHYAS